MADLRSLINAVVPEDLESVLMGVSQPELQQAAVPIAAERGIRPDLAMHELGSALMANRIGAIPAGLAGALREITSGVGQVAQGEPFFSVQGFDPDDMRHNLRGVAQGSKPGQALHQAQGLLALLR